MNLLLCRDYHGTDCTMGQLLVEGLSLVTIERPWVPSPDSKGGTNDISCVPPGTYRLVRHDTKDHPKTWALVNKELDVVHQRADSPNPHARTAVLIHPGNFVSDVVGCIAPGIRAGRDEHGARMAQDSREAMKLLQGAVPWTDEHTLEIH